MSYRSSKLNKSIKEMDTESESTDDRTSSESDSDSNSDSDVEDIVEDNKKESKTNINNNKFPKIYEEINNIKKQIHELQKKEKILYKKLEKAYQSDLKKNSKKKRLNDEPTGFIVEQVIGGKLAKFLEVDDGSKLTGPEISKKFWKKMKEKGLSYEGDGRVLRVDDEVSNIFGVNKSVNKSKDPKDKNGFNLGTYQTYIKYALKNNNKT
jgi:hypothetical protein